MVVLCWFCVGFLRGFVVLGGVGTGLVGGWVCRRRGVVCCFMVVCLWGLFFLVGCGSGVGCCVGMF